MKVLRTHNSKSQFINIECAFAFGIHLDDDGFVQLRVENNHGIIKIRQLLPSLITTKFRFELLTTKDKGKICEALNNALIEFFTCNTESLLDLNSIAERLADQIISEGKL